MSAEPINPYLHEVAITAIIIKKQKYLITRRSLTKKKLPGRWTVPGGKLEVSDYINLPQDEANAWYNILERTLKREVKEETGLIVDNIIYLTSLTTLHPGHAPSLIISCTAKYKSGKVTLQKEETDKYAWVSLKEAKNYDLIEGIYDELEMVKKQKKSKTKLEWKRVDSFALP